MENPYQAPGDIPPPPPRRFRISTAWIIGLLGILAGIFFSAAWLIYISLTIIVLSPLVAAVMEFRQGFKEGRDGRKPP